MVEKGTAFLIADNLIIFEPNKYQNILIRASFYKLAKQLQDLIKDTWKNSTKTFDFLYNNMQKKYIEMLDACVTFGVRVLINNGIDFIDHDQMLDMFGKHFDFEQSLCVYLEEGQRVTELIDELSTRRTIERTSRSKWHGGGFGISGAIKGAVTAGVMNLGTNAIRGIGDSIVNANDRNKVNSLKNSIVWEGKAMKNLIESIDEAMHVIANLVCSILVNEGVIAREQWCSKERVFGKMNNLMDMYSRNMLSGEQMLEKIFECIQAYPFEFQLYQLAFYMIRDPKDISELGQLCDMCGYGEKFFDFLQEEIEKNE